MRRILTFQKAAKSQTQANGAAGPVAADGSVSPEIYPGSRLKGGFTVLELPDRGAAVEWARKIAVACRCAQELREFMYDPAS